MLQIIALGGGGFSVEPDNLALDRYLLAQTGRERPRAAYLPQAGGENQEKILAFYKAYTELGAVPSWLSLFRPHTADLEDYLCAQGLIFVGGGNTRSLIALWREWGLDRILRKAGASARSRRKRCASCAIPRATASSAITPRLPLKAAPAIRCP